MERTKELEAVLGPEKWKAKKLRSYQGAALVGVGVLLVLGSFVLAVIMTLKSATFNVWTLAMPGGALVSGVLVVAFGATFWSGEVVGSVLGDVLPFIKRK